MKNLIKKIILILILLLTAVIIFLSTLGFETSNFNEIISKQIKITYPSADIKLKKIKIKLDLRNRNLFLSTDNPSIVYKKTDVPIKKFDIYFDFLDLLKSKIKIKKAIIEIDEFEINEAKSVLVGIKPSNLKTLLLNNFSNGTIKLNLNIDFNENLKIDDFKVSGYIKKGNLLLSKKIKLINTNFNFIADKKLILINSIKTNYNGLPINNGSIKILKKENLFLEGAFDSRFDIEQNILKKIILNFNQTNILNNKIILKGNILSKFKLNFSETLELLDYDLEVAGEINGSKIIFTNELKNDLLPKSISNLSFDKTKILLNFSKNKKPKILLEGKYSINNDNNFYTFNIKNLVENKNSIFSIDFNFAEDLIIKQLNYKKNLKKIASISALLSIKSNQLVFKKIEYKENNNLIYFENLNINKNGMFNKVDLIKIKTFVKNQVKNDFKINFKDSIKITGNFFDSSNLIRNFTTENKKKKNLFSKINSKIQIKFEKILTKNNIILKNFNLLGEIKNGKFTKITSKSEFLQNKYLDISLKKDLSKDKKVLEIYSDLPEPILSEYNFFKGIKGGKLLFTSMFDDSESLSILTIEDFKLVDAPAFAKLLSLADFSGMGDLLSGEGLTFDKLEIKFTDNKNIMRVEELYAVGPSISVLMDGFIEQKTKLISLRGTMVPAKELNKLISKIPILGNILIGKEIGEGIFGVSFKIKGKPKKLKTTVNPIKTLTPRFITRALEKRKKN